MAQTRYVASQRFDPVHPPALAIYCSDGRFTGAVEELVHQLGHSRLDTLTIPGGPALLNLSTADYSDMNALTRSASFLIHGHDIARVVLLAHAGCGYYRNRYPSETAEQVFDRQLGDLQVAARQLRLVRAELAIDSYYARVEGQHVVFDAVPQEQ